MSYYNELNQLYMEKVAARSYGRNPDGSRRTVDQLITRLGGEHKIKNPTFADKYRDAWGEHWVPQYYVTGDGKYNFSRVKNTTKRINIGKQLLESKEYPAKVVRQHRFHENRLSSGYTGLAGTDTDKPKVRKFNEKKDLRDTFSGRHPKPRIFGEQAKENVKKNKEAIAKSIKKHQGEIGGKIPHALLGTGILMAGMAETNRLYNKIKAKREAENKDKAKKTELLNA